ncbi:hypothetical protein ACFW0H_25945 [Pseudomonas sp. CR3202]|uniref:IS1096 element passenger TnpR family protein n=1 Tax=Pseudomonas sp. CR3202 TaxID=3351532 RepID=UPI003BF0E22F
MDQLHFNPPIWRRIRVKGDCTLRKLRRFIQAALGWNSCHLHEFEKGRNRFIPLDAEFNGMLGNALDDHHFKLRRILPRRAPLHFCPTEGRKLNSRYWG